MEIFFLKIGQGGREIVGTPFSFLGTLLALPIYEAEENPFV